ncbi:cytochrome d ubiquinol oxidase subunit II [Undibacterium sp. Jales W-56]|uniref:cytochrome d ubiquinol oxidase subunit II n=1 Tax=Undibacterium sp. Jales W-56 TaxID=2897325 RepID=UPI0021D33810|nr:cytochrome d ubiquinol oxidase subunit II [Undibacterium sp. Jales W-56]MCU6433360.1 cytochrome d ubiquinol oxidase subunit II [Undibacterium sp. Jales W-56]
MNASPHDMLTTAWFCLTGLMLVFYVVTDGFDLGVGILSLITRKESDRDQMFQSISHVWDANETWLVVVGGALFGAFPAAYAMLLQDLYIPIMLLIASLILRGASIEFRHAAGNKRIWDIIFGLGSLLAALAQGIVLGKIITGLAPGMLPAVFTAVTALGVVSGYALLGATYLVKKTTGQLEQAARRYSVASVLTTVASAIVLSAGTMIFSSIGHDRWAQPGVFNILLSLAAVAALAFLYVLYAIRVNSVRGPFRATILLFLSSFAGLAVSLFPDFVPGKLSIAEAASDSSTLIFMLLGIGTILPVMIGYNLHQYYVFRGKVAVVPH